MLDPNPSREHVPRPSRRARLLADAAHRRCFTALAVVATLLLVAALASADDVTGSAGAWGVGLVAWTLVEYLLHRLLFHLPRRHLLEVLGARQHLDHHARPDRHPISKPMHLTLPAIAIAAATAALVSPPALAVVAGLVAGYLVYELLHVAAHVLPEDHPLPGVQRWHLAHHRDPRSGFGITSPVWDHVLGTTPRR